MEGGEICSKDSDDSNGKDEETERKSNEGNNVKKVYEKKCVKRNISKENAIDDVCQVDEKIEIQIVDEPLETDEIRNGAVNFSSSPVLHLDRLCPPVSTPVNDQDDRVKGTDSSVIFSYNTHKEKFDILPSCSGTSEVISSDHNNEKAIVSEKMPSLLMDCITEDLSSVQVSRVKKAQIYFSMFQSFVSKMQQESEDDGVEQSLVDENSSQISNIPTNSDNDADSIKLKKSGVPEVAAAKERLTSAYQKCTKCAYSTCCRIMINKHAQVFHPEKSHSSAYGIGPPIILPEPLHCTCGFSSRSGNHLARHLTLCKQGCKSAYPSAIQAMACWDKTITSKSSSFSTVDSSRKVPYSIRCMKRNSRVSKPPFYLDHPLGTSSEVAGDRDENDEFL